VEAGSVPIVNGSESMFAGSEDEEWLQSVYDTVSGAVTFQQSWDQALSPTEAETLLDDVEKLLGLAITPEEFAAAMNAAIGS
jgi:raffinose/stachyose/melibiose transport system substrate-binding protein